mmetsp:Transcript_2500/g.3681  ORF Transcript_2500/g.3681 Transcript_2500/m.3681 type:complete len:194 (+) Transcript_2500:95-676(+)|eukprot:CAMPEP_0194210844 /NCGR_PEP_ID=MMETSP0156-20130528/9143_1 /TAXON_ID=33649 /ORGANISM="Thalassionema nitzschioides, Strain L26-B" /LENGTH=193 /DNA_ID=CAMNT_0038938251 /DNA_START=67 /DNA_END=648 /DNA_ORIENTATION=+
MTTVESKTIIDNMDQLRNSDDFEQCSLQVIGQLCSDSNRDLGNVLTKMLDVDDLLSESDCESIDEFDDLEAIEQEESAPQHHVFNMTSFLEDAMYTEFDDAADVFDDDSVENYYSGVTRRSRRTHHTKMSSAAEAQLVQVLTKALDFEKLLDFKNEVDDNLTSTEPRKASLSPSPSEMLLPQLTCRAPSNAAA